jgi:hypothetical protein
MAAAFYCTLLASGLSLQANRGGGAAAATGAGATTSSSSSSSTPAITSPTTTLSPDGDDIVVFVSPPHSAAAVEGAQEIHRSSHFTSLAQARDAIRARRAAAAAATGPAAAIGSRNATVIVSPGRYELSEPLVLGPQDSWTTWRGKEGATDRPVHSGGRHLEGVWTAPSLPGAPWQLKLSGPTVNFNQLWVSGQRATRAREPELGHFYQYVAKLPPPNTGSGFVYQNNSAEARILGELQGHEHEGLEVIVYASWMAARRNVKAINAATNSVVLTSGARISIEPYANSGSRFYLENFRSACDTRGEWYLDTQLRTLLWQPRHEGEDPRTLTFIAPHITGELLLLDGAQGVAIEGQSFRHADWSISPTNHSSGNCQGASFLNSSAVHLRGASGCTLANVTVEHVGQYGIWLEDHSAHNTIIGTMTRDTGAGGIRIGTGKPLVVTIPSQMAATSIRYRTLPLS